jgi:hypothetical protein
MRIQGLAMVGVVMAAGCDGCRDNELGRLRGILVADRAELDFGDVVVFETAAQAVTLSSEGELGVLVDGLSFVGAGEPFAASGVPLSARADSTGTITVSFSPTVTGPFADTLRIASDAEVGALLEVDVRGNGVDPCVDADGDTFGNACRTGPDCDDADSARFPGAPEACNGIDDDCDDAIDEDFPVGDPCGATFPRDDGGSCVLDGVYACAAVELGGVICTLDSPGEVCDGIDNDCNGTVDDPFPNVGGVCYVPEGACRREGRLVCAEDNAGAACVPLDEAALECCPDGQEQNEAGECCPSLPTEPCAVECSIDVENSTTDCSGAVAVDFTARGAVLDLTGRSGVEFTIGLCDPTGFAFHLADSPSSDGYAGDSGTYANDAELHTDGVLFVVYANDYAEAADRTLLLDTDYGSEGGCFERTIWVGDGVVRSFDQCFEVASPFTLRLDPPEDREGPVDSLWHLGLNGIYSGQGLYRTGTGLQRVDLCIR